MKKDKIAVLISSFKEPKTIGKAIESFLGQKGLKKFKLIVSTPDKETQDIVKKYKGVELFEDPGKGKSYAINYALNRIKEDILILSDGDVFVGNNSVEEILKKFENPVIGCVTGRPIPMEDKKTKYGYWANFLFDSAHKLRRKLHQEGKFVDCSGYLYAFRNEIVEDFPLDVADDAIIPYLLVEKGYKIAYAENATVYVKNASTVKDWAKQKIRTRKSFTRLGKYIDLKKYPHLKTFKDEAKGIAWLLKYPKNIKEFFWTIQLVFARIYIWVRYYLDITLSHKLYTDGWERIESTKQ